MKKASANDLMNVMQYYVAVTTLSSSTLRNQGASGVIRSARQFLAALDLTAFSAAERALFEGRLDQCTANLVEALPEGARHWGSARKALNLFLREALYNRYLCQAFHLDALEPWLEVPLDSVVAQGLKALSPRGSLPQWTGLKGLTKDRSDPFQLRAQQIADDWGVARVHLDAYLWPQYR